MSVQTKLIAPLGSRSDVATTTPEPSPTASTPRAKIVGPISGLIDVAPLSAGDQSSLKAKLVSPLNRHEG